MIRFCLSVCPSVCPCIRVSLRESAVTLRPLDGSAQNFQGLLYSLQSNFWAGALGPAGSGPDSEKASFRQIYLLQGFWGRGVVSHLFGIGTTKQTERWEPNFDFWPTAGENAAGRPGWPGGQLKLWKFKHFLLKGPQLKLGANHFLFYATFDPTHPEGPAGTPIFPTFIWQT